MPIEHKVTEVDVATGQLSERSMTESEYQLWLTEVMLEEQRKQEISDINAAMSSARNKLASLGLTDEEINAITGGF